MNSEALIIGGGVIGLGIARELRKRGVSQITLVEKSRCAEESSWAAGGMLGPQAEANEAGLFFDICCLSRDLYPNLAAELLDETGVDIEFDRSGTLYLAFTEDDVSEIRERYEWQVNAGLAVDQMSYSDVHQVEPFLSPDVLEALFFPNDWQVENRRLCTALGRYADLNGIRILENTTVARLVAEGGRITGCVTSSGRISADQTVVATGAWTSLIKLGDSPMPFAISPVRGQMIVFQTAKSMFQRVIYSPRGYIVPRRDGRVLAGSTSENAGFDKTVTESAADKLRVMATEIAPKIAKMQVADQWSGLRPQSADGLPVIGPISEYDGLFIATGHYRNGILLAPWTAKTTVDYMSSGKLTRCPIEFAPDRFKLLGVSTSG